MKAAWLMRSLAAVAGFACVWTLAPSAPHVLSQDLFVPNSSQVVRQAQPVLPLELSQKINRVEI